MPDMHHWTTAFGDIAGGAGDPLARCMIAALGKPLAAGSAIDDATIADAARRIAAEALQSGGRMPGFGIPAHRADPRTPALLKVARENDAAGVYCRLLVAIEDELARVKGRRIPINIDGVVAALVLDLGFPLDCAAAFVMIRRSFSTLAHHLEEKAQGTTWRHVPQETVTYTGPMPPASRSPAG
jgi:citrate synthase